MLDTKVRHLSVGRLAPPTPPTFVTRTAVYPAAVVYILYREYLHKNPGLTTLSPEDKHYQQYLERRLRQLYPTKGYPGMMRDAVDEMRRQRLAWKAYREEYDAWIQSISPLCNDGYDPNTGEPCTTTGDGTTSDPTVDSSWDGQDEHEVPPDEMIPTLQMEIDTLQMTQPEIDQLYYQESLADGSFFFSREELIVTSTGQKATIDDLIRAAGDGWMPPGNGGQGEVVVQVNPAIIAAVLVTGAVIGWKAYRVKQAADRANEKSNEYFGQFAYSSTKRDAHRHIFLNVQMRRHVGSYLTKWITDNHEAEGNNPPGDLAMDYHNNDIGREVKYKNFRGHWLWDRWDWKEWAEKVRNYINTPTNEEYIAEWKTSRPATLQEANARASLVPDWKYIYFAP
ncbi:MAG: hypothetical protein AB1941_09180 [Gemmatimonadota bacterium]